MPLKVLHLNIQGAVRFNDVISYINKHSFDIVQMQEVAGGFFSKSVHHDTFQAIKEHLGYDGVLAKAFAMKGEPESYDGNATFYKKTLNVLRSDVLALRPFEFVEPFTNNDLDRIRILPRNALSLLVEHEGSPLWFVNAHLAWGPNEKDEPEKLRQAQVFKEYLDLFDHPYVLTGDFNVEKDTQVTKIITGENINHTILTDLKNTLSPQLHRAHHLFPPGLAVDFIITTKEVKTRDFSVIDDVLSDHLGLKITIL
ncbi:MAG: hypothetical protein KBC15_03105 [Candidatus Levybacteria bacterium]|nr:hypothetical protein [Candidatus Levybacteria bacterium]